jgi:hypothetical protein
MSAAPIVLIVFIIDFSIRNVESIPRTKCRSEISN